MKEEERITLDEQQLMHIVAEQMKQTQSRSLEDCAQEAQEVVDGIKDSAQLIYQTSLAAIELYRKTKAYLESLFAGKRPVPPDADTAICGQMYLEEMDVEQYLQRFFSTGASS